MLCPARARRSTLESTSSFGTSSVPPSAARRAAEPAIGWPRAGLSGERSGTFKRSSPPSAPSVRASRGSPSSAKPLPATARFWTATLRPGHDRGSGRKRRRGTDQLLCSGRQAGEPARPAIENQLDPLCPSLRATSVPDRHRAMERRIRRRAPTEGTRAPGTRASRRTVPARDPRSMLPCAAMSPRMVCRESSLRTASPRAGSSPARVRAARPSAIGRPARLQALRHGMAVDPGGDRTFAERLGDGEVERGGKVR